MMVWMTQMTQHNTRKFMYNVFTKIILPNYKKAIVYKTIPIEETNNG